jgi:hypothetical protein
MVLFYGLPRRQFSVHFALLIAAESTLGALLEPLFGLFQKVNSPKFGCMGSRKQQLCLAAPHVGKETLQIQDAGRFPSIRTPSGVFGCYPLVAGSKARQAAAFFTEASRRRCP